MYDVMDNSKIAVVAFNSVARIEAELKSIGVNDIDTRQRLGSALSRNPSTVPESHKCILCGLQEAVRALRDSPKDLQTDGATIILVTSGSGTTTDQQLDEMVRLVNNENFKIMLVLYPLKDRPGSLHSSTTHGLNRLTDAGAGGTSFAVMDEGVGNDSKVSMLVALMDALFSSISINGFSDTPGAPVLVHSMAYPGGISADSAGLFALDDSLGPDVRFSVYYYALDHIGNNIDLKSPSGVTIKPSQEEDGDVNMLFVKIEKAEVII